MIVLAVQTVKSRLLEGGAYYMNITLFQSVGHVLECFMCLDDFEVVLMLLLKCALLTLCDLFQIHNFFEIQTFSYLILAFKKKSIKLFFLISFMTSLYISEFGHLGVMAIL